MSDDVELTDVLTAVGPRLRALRKARGATLARLSEETGISLSTLSRLEAGQREPTLKLLLPLAKAYGVPLDELVGAPQTGDPRIHPRPFMRHGNTWVPLTRYLGGMHAYKQVMPVAKKGRRQGARSDEAARPEEAKRPEQGMHEGYEWLYVLSGRLLLALGEHDLVLTAGEAAEFDTRTPHGFANAGDIPVEFLALYGAQGERMHVRVKPGSEGDGGGE